MKKKKRGRTNSRVCDERATTFNRLPEKDNTPARDPAWPFTGIMGNPLTTEKVISLMR